MFIILNYNFYKIIKLKKDITEKVCLVDLHGLAAADAGTDPSAVLQSHEGASLPKRRSGERLVDAVLRAELAFRTAAALCCQLAAACRFWAVFGLVTPAKQSSYTGRPGVLAWLRRLLHESEEDATST
jgi:hypothetical protein